MKDITNQKFGKLIAIRPENKPSVSKIYQDRCQYWYCQCECGKTTIVKGAHLRNGNTKSCGCLHKRSGHESPFFKGCGEIPLDVFSTIKRNALGGGKSNRKAKEFTITIEYIWELFLKQDRKCAISGLTLSFDGTRKENKTKSTSKITASLDRIDSSRGYVEGNVQWVHKKINIMKNETSQEEFISFCRAVTDYNENRLTKN